MKTKTIGISNSAINQALSACQKENIKAAYLGIGYSGDLLMEFSYEASQEPFIRQLTDYINRMVLDEKEMEASIRREFAKAGEKYEDMFKPLSDILKIQIIQPFKYTNDGRERE